MAQFPMIIRQIFINAQNAFSCPITPTSILILPAVIQQRPDVFRGILKDFILVLEVIPSFNFLLIFCSFFRILVKKVTQRIRGRETIFGWFLKSIHGQLTVLPFLMLFIFICFYYLVCWSIWFLKVFRCLLFLKKRWLIIGRRTKSWIDADCHSTCNFLWLFIYFHVLSILLPFVLDFSLFFLS